MSHLSIPAVLLILAIGALLIRRELLRRRLIDYGHRFENIYVISEHPDDRNLYLRKTEEEQWLQRADNQFAVQVKVILFRDAQHPNETWEEYGERYPKEIAADREQRHALLYAEQGEAWYLANVARQRGIEVQYANHKTQAA